MKEELKEEELLKRDVNFILSLTPFVPYLGFLSSGITVGKHISNHMYNKAETKTM